MAHIVVGDFYPRLLCKLYKFLARRTDSKFNKAGQTNMGVSQN